jgi:hypothetical protein
MPKFYFNVIYISRQNVHVQYNKGEKIFKHLKISYS